MLGRSDEARAILAVTRAELAERGGGIQLATTTGQTSVDVELLAGDPAAAAELGAEGCRLLDELGEKGSQSTAAGKLAQALYALERLEEADAWAGRAAELVERIRGGDRVALVTDAGMPAVSDPGTLVVAAVAAAGLPVIVLPGPSAVTAAVAAAGFGGAGFVFAGFLPKPAARAVAELRRLDACRLPVVAFESPRRLPATLAALAAANPDRQAAVCRELTKLHEQVERGRMADLADRFAIPPKGEVTLVVAAAQARADTDVPAAALAELAAAVGTRRAAELGSRLTGLPRNRLYQALTKP